MKATALALTTILLLCAGCAGDDSNLAKQSATERSAAQPGDPYTQAQEASDPVAESPEQTQRDVLAAREDAREAETQTDAAAEVVAADSKRRIELERCDAKTGVEREQCISKANADFERVKERVSNRLDEEVEKR